MTWLKLYLRFIGDRELNESDFGRIRRGFSSSLKSWAKRVRSVSDRVNEIYVFSNNHYEGFAPETINRFRRLMGLHTRDWLNAMQKISEGQRTLF